jgi:hypothetical protein
MNRVVQISDAPRGVLVHAADVLSLLEPEATELRWTILDLREPLRPKIQTSTSWRSSGRWN